MERRIFIKNACLSCAGMAISGGILSGCGSVHWAAVSLEGTRLVVKKSEFVFLKKGQPVERKWVLVKPEKAPFPIGVFRFDDDRFAASYLQCSHQGCEVAPEGDHLHCPCHGSEFSNIGKLQKGPAESDLKTFMVTTDQTNLYILLK